MLILTIGLVVFLGVHLLPVVPAARTALRTRLGENAYKGMFSALSALGFVLMVAGYAHAPRGEQLFAPLAEARMLAPLAMIISFILLAAANMKAHLRRVLKHPMLLGVGIWATVHLLANGHLKASLLFGAFLAYALLDIVSATLRGAGKSFEPQLKHDFIAVAGGTVTALAFMGLHRLLIGVPAVRWGW